MKHLKLVMTKNENYIFKCTPSVCNPHYQKQKHLPQQITKLKNTKHEILK